MILATYPWNLSLGQVAPIRKSAFMGSSVPLTEYRLFPDSCPFLHLPHTSHWASLYNGIQVYSQLNTIQYDKGLICINKALKHIVERVVDSAWGKQYWVGKGSAEGWHLLRIWYMTRFIWGSRKNKSRISHRSLREQETVLQDYFRGNGRECLNLKLHERGEFKKDLIYH